MAHQTLAGVSHQVCRWGEPRTHIDGHLAYRSFARPRRQAALRVKLLAPKWAPGSGPSKIKHKKGNA